jgi:hypothetical protein
MSARRVQLIGIAAVAVALAAPWIGTRQGVSILATCPNGMVPNPAGYGCVPDRPGVGAPSEEVLTRCSGNYYLCVWPYPTQ